MAAPSKPGMTAPEIKKLLAMASEGKPLRCAIGVGGDGPAFVMLDRLKQPRALEAEMKKDHPDAKIIRFGTAFVNENKSNQVDFALNKPASGLAKRIVKALKGSGYSKVNILSKDENGLDVSDNAGEEEEEAAAAGASPSPAPGAEHQAAAPQADPQPASPAPAPAEPAPPVAAAPAAGQAEIRPAEVRTPAAPAAEPLVTPPSPQNGPAKPASAEVKPVAARRSGAQQARSPATVEKAKSAWIATLQKMEKDVDSLLTAMTTAYEGHGFASQIETTVRAKVAPALAKLDRELVETLDLVIDAADEGAQTKAVYSALKKIRQYKALVEGEPLFKKLDDNPFSPLMLVKTVSTSLKVLDKAVASMV